MRGILSRDGLVHSCHLYSVSWLCGVYELPIQNDFNGPRQLARRSIFRQFLDDEALVVIVLQEPVIWSHPVSCCVLSRKCVPSILLQWRHLEVVRVRLDYPLLSLLHVVVRLAQLGAHNGHPSHYSLHLYQLIDEMSLEASWGHIPVSEVALHVHFEIDLLGWETSLTLCCCHLFIPSRVTHVFDELIEHFLEVEDALLGISQELPGKSGVKLPDLIKIDIEFLGSATLHELSNLFLNI